MVESEVELLTREAVTVLLDVGPRYDGHLLARDGAGCEKQRKHTRTNTSHVNYNFKKRIVT